MRKSFILVGMLMACLSLLAEENSEETQPTCAAYFNAMTHVPKNFDWSINFIPDWFEHLEYANNNNESIYDEDFLQEHGGRAGTLVYGYKIENDVDCEASDDDYDDEENDDDWIYDVGCSGTLIGRNYFITAGHCAVKGKVQTEEGCARMENVGVLFGYQMADLENNEGDNGMNNNPNNTLKYPRVSINGYLDNAGNYKQYGEPGGYLNHTKHPAYFPIDSSCNDDGSQENGWKKICPSEEYEDNDNNDINKKIITASELRWPTDFHLVFNTNNVDYAIYKLKTNDSGDWPSEYYDPWPWISQNNQLSQNTSAIFLFRPWELPDNTNGFRGWARVNTSILQENTVLNIIGFPGYATDKNNVNFNYKGLKVINTGRVVNGATVGFGHSHFEDILIFKEANIQNGHSGSSVIDYSGRLAGVVSWTGCKPGKIWITDLDQPAENYATPMWKICRVSQIIKNAAKDQDCNGIIDWWDLLGSFENIDNLININGLLIDRFGLHPIPLDLKNYRYDARQQRVVTETKEIPAYTYQVAFQNNGNLFYVAKQNNTFYLFQNGTALGAISDYPEMSGSSTLVKGNDIYFAGGNLSIPTPMLPGSGNNSFQPYITKISSDGQNGYNFSVVAVFPTNLEDIRIFALGNDIYLSGNTATNFVVYKLGTDNQSEFGYSLSLVSDTTQPVRKDYNLTAADGKIIVSGGATDYISTVLNLDEAQYPSTFAVYNNIIMLEPDVSNNWITVAENINDKLIMMSVTAIDDGNLVLVNPFITVGNSMQKFVIDLDNIPVSGDNLRVSFESHTLVFCLNESGTTISGGLELGAECVSFTHPFYNSFSAGTTVYSVAGKGNRLYAGTNDSIKIYDISDQNSPVLVSSFSTNNARVNDLEIEGEVLFAATSKGLYKLDASDPDELEQILFVSTGSTGQNEIELYDGKVYVGDDNGIKIMDKETLSVLLSANSGQVYDFAIENGEIAMFRSSFWNSGIQFRNAETLVETAYDYTSCSSVEVENFNGRLYLACDNYNYSFEANNGYIYFTQLSGDKRDLRENYTYNGYTYTPDGNHIRLSTNEDVPAICGNGIVEGDEVCDGTPIDCAELDESYVSGIAACNSTCDGYVLDNCTAGNGGDGW